MMLDRIRALLAPRPWWMNAIWLFCLYMTFVYLPFDLFLKPVERDAEVWLGFALHGWLAKATEPIHWLIYGFGAYGFWRMRPWLWPWAALYTAQVAIGMVVWSVAYSHGGLALGLVPGVLIGAIAVALWRAKPRFRAGNDWERVCPR